MAESDLDTLLSDTTATPAAPQNPTPDAAPAPTEAAAPAPTTGETPSAAPPADATDQQSEPETVPFAVARDERRKRQDAERRLRELEEQVKAKAQPPAQAQPQQPPHLLGEIDPYVLDRYQERVAIYEEMYRDRYPDYDESVKAFVEAAGRNKHLQEAALHERNPVRFAYESGKRLRLMAEIGDDPAAYRAKVEAEVRAQMGLTTSPAPQAGTAPQARAPVPRSMARDVSQQPRDTRGRFEGPAPLEELLG